MANLYNFMSTLGAFEKGQSARARMDQRRDAERDTLLQDEYGDAIESGNYQKAAGTLGRLAQYGQSMEAANQPIKRAQGLADFHKYMSGDRSLSLNEIEQDVTSGNFEVSAPAPKKTAQMQNYEYARQNGFGGSFMDYQRQGGSGGGAPTYGKSPIFGTDANGNSVLLQVSDAGTSVQTPLPEGFTPTAGLRQIDTGTNVLLVDKKSGNIVSKTPKDVAGQAEQNTIGKGQGEEFLAAPGQLAQAERMLSTINGLMDDPNRERGTGKSSVFNSIPSTKGFDYQQKANQLQGQAFLQAYDALRGGGQITEVEGAKAEAAMARLSTAQSEEAYLEGLQDLAQIIQNGKRRLEITIATGRQRQPRNGQQGGGTTANGAQWRIK